jgi:hypothetical protein
MYNNNMTQKWYIMIIFFFSGLVAPTQYRSYGDSQALLVEEDLRCHSGALLCIISYRDMQLSKTIDFPQASCKASSHKIIKKTCQDSNP